MNFGMATGEKDGIAVTHAALAAGVNFIDTADCYSRGRSEEIVGKAIKGKRDSIVLATKCWAPMGKGPNECGSSRYHVMQSCENSLRRLGTDHVDLYIIHRPDREWPGTPAEETLSAMTDLVRQGKVRYIGTSTFNAWRLVEAQWVSRFRNYERYCSEQLNYSIMNRYVEKDILRVCQRYGIGVTIWSPLNWGWLSGKYRRGQALPEGSRASRGFRVNLDSPEGKKNLEIVDKLLPLAEQRGITLSQFSLAWLLKNPLVTSVICGPRLLSHFEDNVAADAVELDDDAMKAVDEIVPPATGDDREWW
jgi:aryl-alcohol dehydrogenase (NADP+)